MCKILNENVGLDAIYDYVDDLLIEGDIGRVNKLLGSLDPTGMTSAEMLAYLTITIPLRNEIPNRTSFRSRVEIELAYRFDAEKVRRLMEGL